MRRKVVSATPKALEHSGLPCRACTAWEGFSGASGQAGGQSAKSQHMRGIIKAWGECGKIIYVDNAALAYAQYAPAEHWSRSAQFASGPVSRDAVLLACLYVVPEARGRGLGRVLLQSVESGLVKRKIKAIEVFAARTEQYSLGPVEFYLQNGFFIVQDDPHYPRLRLELKALVGWHINVQLALDSLRIPGHRPVSSPA